MHWSRKTSAASSSLLFALFLGLPPAPAAAQASASPETRVSKSVRGSLVSVDSRLQSVVMKADTGESLTWRFSPAVIAEAAKFKTGAPVIVIYRQIAANEKRVTALAFPGAASRPIYVNLTGARISLRSAGGKDQVCGQGDPGPVTESVLPPGERADIKDACWCCAPSGEACTTGNRTGNGLAFLERCFE
jgi:hypothetical protein